MKYVYLAWASKYSECFCMYNSEKRKYKHLNLGYNERWYDWDMQGNMPKVEDVLVGEYYI